LTWQKKAFMVQGYGIKRDRLMKKNKKVSLPKKPSLVLSRRAVIGWTCFIFFVCAWMFVIGVLVGRGTAPVKFDIAGIQKKLEASLEDLKNREQQRTRGKSGIAKDKTKLGFYEALRDNREDIQIGKKRESSPETKPPLTIDGKAEKKIIGKTEPSETGPAKPSQKPPVDSKSKTRPTVKTYTIQVASVKDARDADRLVAKLKKKRFHAYRAIGKVPGKGIWYRVRVGEYKSKASARHTLNKLRKTGLKPFVVEK
jgi:cell division septation protein DedD